MLSHFTTVYINRHVVLEATLRLTLVFQVLKNIRITVIVPFIQTKLNKLATINL